MPAVSDLLDLVSSTRKKFKKMSWVDAASRYQSYPLCGRWLKRGKEIEDGGTAIEFDIRLSEPGTARNVGLHQSNPVNQVDMMTKGSVDWRHTENYWVFERREELMNRGNSTRLYNLMKMRREAAMIDTFGRVETDGWNKPASSADTTTPYGLKYYVVPNATQGFNGGAPTGFTTVAGITPTTNYKNWTDTFTAITPDDFGEKARLAILKCNFDAPLTSFEAGDARRAVYTTTNGKIRVESMARDNNDRLGFDILATAGKTTINGWPFIHVPAIDADTEVGTGGVAFGSSYPFYFIDHEHLMIKVLEGDNLYEHPARELDQQPNTIVNYIDLTWNLYCDNRRNQAILIDESYF